MYLTRITADLPSVELAGAAAGDDAFAKTHDALSFGSAQLLDLLRRTFAEVGITDVAWVRVDDDLVYVDEDADTDDEIGDLLLRAAKGGFLGRAFQELEVGLVYAEQGVGHVLEVLVRSEVPAGEPELTLSVSSRPDELLPIQGETAAEYAARLTSLASRETRLVAAMARVQDLRDRIRHALQMAFHHATVEAGDVHLVVVRPDRAALDGLAGVPWGKGVLGPSYDLAPKGRWPFWDDPYLKVFDDPSLVARHLLLLEAIMGGGHLRQPWVQVVEGSGKVLFAANQASAFVSWPWRRHFELDLGQVGLAVRWVDPA